MKFTSEDLMKAMGLQVGDRIRINDGNIFKVISEDTIQSIESEYCTCLCYIIDHDFEILPRPKKVGDLKCSEFDSCITCPLQWLCFRKIDEKNEMETSLYEMLESFVVTDQEIYDLLKARLDKEVKEC